MGRQSSIKSLPPDVKTALDSCLAEGNVTLDDLVKFLEEHGYTISRSSLGRYRQNFEEVAQKLRESREVAAAFARELGAVPGDEMGQLLLEMVHTLVFKVCNTDNALEPKDVMFLASTIKNLSESRRISARTALEIRAAEKKRLEEEMKNKLAAAQGQGGLAEDAAREARRILGFSDD